MTVQKINKTQEVVTTKQVVAGVEYASDSSERGVRITPSTSQPGRFTVTVSNPDGDNELAVILKKADMEAFLTAALSFVRYGQ